MSPSRKVQHSWLLVLMTLFFPLPIWGQEGADPSKRMTVQSFSGAYLAARAATANNDVPAAIDYFQQALTLDPDNAQIQEELLLLLLANNEFTKAVPLAHALKDNPQIERVSRLTLVADAFLRQNFDQIPPLLELEEPDLMDALIAGLMRSWALFGKGDSAAAIIELQALEGPVWYDFFRQYHLALLYRLSGDAAQAQAAFERALEGQIEATSSPDGYERAVAAFSAHLQAINKKEEAVALLREGTKTLIGRRVLDFMLLATQADENLPPLVENAHEGAAEVFYTIGTAINRPGSEVYSRFYLNIALSLRPNHDATLFQLADLEQRMRQPQAAIAFYQRLQPDSFYFRDGQWRLGLLLADMGRKEQAIELLQTLLETSGDENLTLALASIHMQSENFGDVITLLDSHFKQRETTETAANTTTAQPQEWRLFFQRGIAHERLKQWAEAEADFRHALTLSPEQPQVLNYLGYSLIDRDMKLEEALEMVRRAAQLRPKDGAIIDSLGWAYYKIGHYDEAIAALEEAVRLRPEDPTINDHLGDAYWQVGRKFEAVFQWKHALAGAPEPEELAKIEIKLKNGL